MKGSSDYMKQTTQGISLLFVALLLWASATPSSGQTERPRLTTPSSENTEDGKKLLTEEELSAISKPENSNNRMKTYVRLTVQRLKKAREYANQENYLATSEQIQGYTFLVADAGRVSKELIPPHDKAHKTLEIALREQVRLLEGFKYDITLAYAVVVETALQTATQVRRQALKLFLGDEGLLSEKVKFAQRYVNPHRVFANLKSKRTFAKAVALKFDP